MRTKLLLLLLLTLIFSLLLVWRLNRIPEDKTIVLVNHQIQKIVHIGDLVTLRMKILNQNGEVSDIQRARDILIGSHALTGNIEERLIGMKIGEHKILSTNYASGSNDRLKQVIPLQQIASEYTMTGSRKVYFENVNNFVPLADYPDARVGDEINTPYGSGIVQRVVRDSLEVQMENFQSPFYGRDIAIGLEGESGNKRLKIISVRGDTIVFRVTNLNSPFAGKEIVSGLQADYLGKSITVDDVYNDAIVISFDHPIVQNTFDIEIVNIH